MNNIIPSEASAKQEAFKKENIQLKIQVEKLKAQVCSLQEELHTLDDGVERLPLVRFIEYAEMYPPEQNEYARTVKELLRDVYTSFSNEERARLRALGHKPLHAADLVARSATPAERHAASLPPALGTPQAHALLGKLVQAGMLDERWQPVGLSLAMKGVLARTVAERLEIQDMWQCFGILWGMKPDTLRKADYNAQDKKKILLFQDALKEAFDSIHPCPASQPRGGF